MAMGASDWGKATGSMQYSNPLDQRLCLGKDVSDELQLLQAESEILQHLVGLRRGQTGTQNAAGIKALQSRIRQTSEDSASPERKGVPWRSGL